MIIVKDVSKKLGGKEVLKEVSFHIAPNECVGIIGRNGAGKTTLLNIMSGILKQDSGFVRINGCKDTMQDFNTLKCLSYVSGMKAQLWTEMKLIYSFENCGKMYGINSRDFSIRLEELLEVFDIKDCLQEPVKYLSFGQRIRSELVYALLPKPKILFLDEALIGLDVTVKDRIMRIVEKMKENKEVTILYTSHNLMEIEKICDRLILLDKGNILFDGRVERLMKEFAPEYQIDIETEGDFPDLEDLPVEKYGINKNILSVRYDKQKVNTSFVIRHIISRCRVKNVMITEPNLEDTIKKIYERKDGI